MPSPDSDDEPCPACEGVGLLWDLTVCPVALATCPHCKGTGKSA